MLARMIALRPSRRMLPASLLLALVACGSPPPPAQPAPPKPVAAPAVLPADVSAVPEPKNLVVFARLAKPSEALKVIGGWTHLPMPLSESVVETMTGEPLGPIVDLDQPLDFALQVLPRGMSIKPVAAISAAVRSMDEAKRVFTKFKTLPGENGALRIEGLGRVGGEEEDVGDVHVCELAPAFGAAATRLVCADSAEALSALGPYLTRTAPRTSFPSDFHLEARFEPLRPVVEQSRRALPLLLGSLLGVRRGGAAGLDEAWNASVGDLVDFVGDTDKITVDAMLADPQGTLTINAGFRSTTSFVARLATAHPERAEAPPATFWRLPLEADAAYFHRGIDAKDFEHPRDHLVAAITGSTEKEGLVEADRKAFGAAAQHTFDLLALPSVYAKGLDLAEAQKALAAVKTAKAGDEEPERLALEQMAGWWVTGVEQEPAKVVAIAKEWSTLWARPGIAKWVKEQSKDGPPPTIKVAPLPKGLTLPKEAKDSVHLEIALFRPHHQEPAAKGKPAPKPPAGKPIKLHLLVLPDGARSWLVLASDEATLVAKAKAVLTPAADGAATLARRGGLESMRDARVNAAGFVSPRGLVAGTAFGWLLGQKYGALHRDVFEGVGASPQQGATPIPFSFTSQAGAGATPGGSFTASAALPRGAIEDLVRIVSHGMRHW
jgi:hypothetical protein